MGIWSLLLKIWNSSSFCFVGGMLFSLCTFATPFIFGAVHLGLIIVLVVACCVSFMRALYLGLIKFEVKPEEEKEPLLAPYRTPAPIPETVIDNETDSEDEEGADISL